MSIPKPHINFLHFLKNEKKFIPKVVYDIGAASGEWTKVCTTPTLWPYARYYLVDAYEPFQPVLARLGHNYAMALLSDANDKLLRFYENSSTPSGNSYYRETFFPNTFPKNIFTEKKSVTLDTLSKQLLWPKPDLIKIDVQGAELDVIRGAIETFTDAKYLIVELQNVQYNEGAPLAHISIPQIEALGWKLIAEKFDDHGPDADYCFIKNNFVNSI